MKLIRDVYGVNPLGLFNSLPSFIYVLGGCLIWEEMCFHKKWNSCASFPFFIGSLLYEAGQLFYSGTFAIMDMAAISFGYMIYLLVSFFYQRKLKELVLVPIKDPDVRVCAPSDQ